MVKTVFDAATGALVGAHMIGGEVTEMIQGFALALTLEATEAELIATIFPHPTMSEAMHEASLDAFLAWSCTPDRLQAAPISASTILWMAT